MGTIHSVAQLRLVVFFSGLSVMAVEMTGLRLLAPFFGTSLLVTTILIGSMMLFLSVGYALGGRYGDRDPTIEGLCRVVGIAGALVIAIPFLGQPILRGAAAIIRPLLLGETIAESQVAIAMVVGGLIGILALFAAPVTLMGMVSPWAVRLAVHDVESAGKVAGRLYAVSTIGSIIGSFLPALVLIPTLGVRNTFLVVGVLLLAASLPVLWGPKKGTAATTVCVPLLLLPSGIIRPMPGLVMEQESLYHFIQVVVEPYGNCAEANHLYLNEGVGVHSVKCLDASTETRGYWAYLAAAPLYRPDPSTTKEVLVVGLAGGTVARQLLESWPDAHVDGVEIDGAVVRVGEEYFDNADPRITSRVMDGRVFLQAIDKRYSVIVVDAYRQPYIPFHLTTVEFWREVADHLDSDGVVAINIASVRGQSRGLAVRIYKTMKEVFPTVHFLNATTSNDVLFATVTPTHKHLSADNLERMPSAKGLDQIRPKLRKSTFGAVRGWESAEVLTDDQAPVELIWDLMTLDYAR